MAPRQTIKNKSTYTAILHHANKHDYKVVQIESIPKLLNIITKFNRKIIINVIEKYLHTYIMQCGINPDDVDFMITIYDDYIE